MGGGIAGLAAAYFLRDQSGRCSCWSRRPGWAASWRCRRWPASPWTPAPRPCSPAGPKATGPDQGGRPGRRPGVPGHHGRQASGPGASSGRCRDASSWECPRDFADLERSAILSRRGLAARAAGRRCCRPRAGTATWRSPSSSAPGSAPRWWTASSIRCSAASTRAGPISSPSRRRCPPWPRRPGRTGRWPARVIAARPAARRADRRADGLAAPRRRRRSSPPSPTASARFLTRSRGRAAPRCAPRRRCASWPGPRPAGG